MKRKTKGKHRKTMEIEEKKNKNKWNKIKMVKHRKG